MFNRSGKSGKGGTSSGSPAGRVDTSIGANTSVSGTLKTDGDIRMNRSYSTRRKQQLIRRG